MAEIREIEQTGDRRRAREYALQILYQIDVAPAPLDECLAQFWEGRQARQSVASFARRLVEGVVGHREGLDSILSGISHHWRLHRMAIVDRNVLRLALYEMLFEDATPRIVVINEAIEIVKKFGDDESGPFINGILDALRIGIERDEISLADGEPGSSKGPLRTTA